MNAPQSLPELLISSRFRLQSPSTWIFMAFALKTKTRTFLEVLHKFSLLEIDFWKQLAKPFLWHEKKKHLLLRIAFFYILNLIKKTYLLQTFELRRDSFSCKSMPQILPFQKHIKSSSLFLFFFARQDQVLMSKNPFYQLIDHCQSGPVASSIGYYRATVSLWFGQ